MKKLLVLLSVLQFAISGLWATDYKLVTSESQLVAGCKYIIANGTSGSVYVASTEKNDNNRRTLSASVADGIISSTTNMLVVQLGGSKGAWTFTTQNYLGANGFLYNDDTKNNRLKVGTNSAYNKFTITFSGNKISSILCNGNKKGNMYFNTNSGSPLVACYGEHTETQYSVPQLYKEVIEEEPPTTTTYDVVASKAEGGTYTVKIGSAEAITIENASNTLSAEAGETIKLQAFPNSWHKVVDNPFSVVANGGANIEVGMVEDSYSFVMPAEPVQISVSFAVIESYLVWWSINGANPVADFLDESEPITFPTAADIEEYMPKGTNKVLAGWSETEVSQTDEKPHLVTEAVATEDITYYAVFATPNQNGPVRLSAPSQYNSTYTDFALTDDAGNTWNMRATRVKDEDPVSKLEIPSIGLNKREDNAHIASPVFDAPVSKIKMMVYNASTANRAFYLCSSNKTAKPTSGDLGVIPVGGSEKFVEKEFVPSQEFNQFYIYSSDALRIQWIEVTVANGISYSAYTTYTQPATVAETSKNVTNVCFPVSTAVPNGTKVYYATDLTDGVLNLVRVGEDEVLAADKGYVVVGEPGTYDFDYKVGNSSSDNILKGVTLRTARTSISFAGTGVYAYPWLLTKDAEFKKYTGDYIPAFKAYLDGGYVQANNASNAQTSSIRVQFIDDESSTAIQTIECKADSDAMIDLYGRHVNGSNTGLYLNGNKKVFIK